MEDKKETKYKVKLWRYLRVKGYEEEKVFSNFYPGKVDDFAVIQGRHNSTLYMKKYAK